MLFKEHRHFKIYLRAFCWLLNSFLRLAKDIAASLQPSSVEFTAVLVNASAVVISKAFQEHIECTEEQLGPHASDLSATMAVQLWQLPQAATRLEEASLKS